MVATRLSVAEFEATCGDDRVELIDGDVVPMSPASEESSGVNSMAHYVLSAHIVPRKLGRVYGAETGFVLFPGRNTVVAPDVSFLRADRLPHGKARKHFIQVPPDLAVEVIAPSDRPRDIAAKIALYQEAGVPLVWLADPEAQTVTVFALGQEPVVLGIGDELDGGDVLPEFRVAVTTIFA
ncbi:MAG: Uma2 family endonuclease [Thermomicrobiales bacterium]